MVMMRLKADGATSLDINCRVVGLVCPDSSLGTMDSGSCFGRGAE